MASPGDDLSTPKGRARATARLMDNAVRIPVIDYRVGIDPVLTLVPVAGNVIATLISLYVVFEGWRAGAGPLAVGLMLGIIAVDAVIGFVPIAGPFLDTAWKANAWNVRIIERET
ncbi:DUF4112 domain-containing protein [Natronomonas sp.]|uniref:DUF4112 domain-containing protein n=1 Tax=Natronomonas sp. TaxID=2184060 RepID=UPI003975C278